MNNVNKTLYIPLYGKAYVSQKGILLSDKKPKKFGLPKDLNLAESPSPSGLPTTWAFARLCLTNGFLKK